jgi:hypothetical protein
MRAARFVGIFGVAIWLSACGDASLEVYRFAAGPPCANPNQTRICHVPPGNPSNAHTICVGDPAVDAHLDHGDWLGTCDDGATPQPSGTGMPTPTATATDSPTPTPGGTPPIPEGPPINSAPFDPSGDLLR